MFFDVLGQLAQVVRATLITIPLDNPLSYLYVILDILSKVLLLGNSPAGGGFDFLPF